MSEIILINSQPEFELGPNDVPNLGNAGVRATHLVRGETGVQVTHYHIDAGRPFGGEWQWDQAWICYQGEGRICQDGPNAFIVPYGPGSMFFFPARVRHLVRATTDSLFSVTEGDGLKTVGPWREWNSSLEDLTEGG